MSDSLELQTLHLIEKEETSWIEFNKVFSEEQSLRDFQKLMDYFEDYSSAKIIVFRNLDYLNQFLSSIDEFRNWEKVFDRLNRLRAVTISVIQGACLGLSFQLTISCDFRVARSNSTLQSIEVKNGYLPGMIIFRLAKFIGIGIAKRILFMGLPYKVEDAFQVGLIDMVFSEIEEQSTIDEFIKSLLPVQPIAIQLTRRLLDESFANTYDETIGHFIAAQYKCLNPPPKQITKTI